MAQPNVLEGMLLGITGFFDSLTGKCEREPVVPEKSPEPRPSAYATDQRRASASPPARRASRTGSLSRASSSSSNASADMAVFAKSSSVRRMSRPTSVERSSGSRGSSVGSARSGKSGRSPSVERSPLSREKPKGMAKALAFDDNRLYKAKWRSFELFKQLDEDDMQQCIDSMKVRSYSAGDTIIKRGSIGTTMFFIDLGTARAEIRGHTATELKSGDYFGEIAFTATCGKFLRDKSDKTPPEQAVRVADIKATSTCRMLEFSVKDFLTILQDNGKEQNREILSSLSKKCDERKANARRLDSKQYREKKQGSARDAWSELGMEDARKR